LYAGDDFTRKDAALLPCTVCRRRRRGPSSILLAAAGLYETGADIATLELEMTNDGDSQPSWRLYRVNEPVTES
jgi:hypothetical protein